MKTCLLRSGPKVLMTLMFTLQVTQTYTNFIKVADNPWSYSTLHKTNSFDGNKLVLANSTCLTCKEIEDLKNCPNYKFNSLTSTDILWAKWCFTFPLSADVGNGQSWLPWNKLPQNNSCNAAPENKYECSFFIKSTPFLKVPTSLFYVLFTFI